MPITASRAAPERRRGPVGSNTARYYASTLILRSRSITYIISCDLRGETTELHDRCHFAPSFADKFIDTRCLLVLCAVTRSYESSEHQEAAVPTYDNEDSRYSFAVLVRHLNELILFLRL